MNKQELVESLAVKAESCSKAEAAKHLNAFLDIVKGTLKKGEKVCIAGFGTFSRRVRKARKGVNPRTGAKIQIPSAKVVKFTVGSAFKKAVK